MEVQGQVGVRLYPKNLVELYPILITPLYSAGEFNDQTITKLLVIPCRVLGLGISSSLAYEFNSRFDRIHSSRNYFLYRSCILSISKDACAVHFYAGR